MVDGQPKNLADTMVSEGLAEVKHTGKSNP